MKLFFCQNDPLMGESFWQNNSLLTHILFSIIIFSPVANFGDQSRTTYMWVFSGWKTFMKRRTAVAKINSLPIATEEELTKHDDVCAICYMEMTNAKVTRCRHFFHSVCLRKWLYMQDTCPLCHAVLYKEQSEKAKKAAAGAAGGAPNAAADTNDNNSDSSPEVRN